MVESPHHQDISYDMELSRATAGQRANMKKTLLGQESVRRAAEQVFRRHGALSVQMSHLLPKGKEQGGDSIAILGQFWAVFWEIIWEIF